MPSSPYFLAVDVGNTATSCCLFPYQKPVSSPHVVWTIGTNDLKRPLFYRRFLVKNLKRSSISLRQVQGVIVSSVVPSVDAKLKKEFQRLFPAPVHFVSAKTPSQVKIRYSVPSEVGADRLVNARAAIQFWKGPSIVIDFGTATTFDCISKRKEYLGGVIAPGPVISAEALYQKTAKLPLVLLKEPTSILGRNTLKSVQAGLYHGYRGLVKEVVLQLKKKMGSSTRVFATGGQARWILNGLSVVDRHVPHLTLMGLAFLWKDLIDERHVNTLRFTHSHKGKR